MTLRIRLATLADAALLKELGYSVYPAHFRHLWKSESELNDFLKDEYSLSVLERSLTDKRISWYVAETERPIGFIKLTWEATIPGTDISGVLLNKLYLDPTNTNKKYGQIMFERVMALAISNRKHFLWLEVLEQNVRAYKFYRKQGMRCIKDIVFETASQRSILKVMGIKTECSRLVQGESDAIMDGRSAARRGATHFLQPEGQVTFKHSTSATHREDFAMTTFYQLTATRLDGQPVAMADYAGKVVLVVNTASHCGFTPQYAGLEALYKKYAAQGLVVLGFPCNQFGKQEPGSADDIAQTCHINYGVSFPVLEKTEVNGTAAHPVFRYLKNALPGVLGGRIKWNFTKFLIGRDGKPLKRFAPFTTPEKMEAAIAAALEI